MAKYFSLFPKVYYNSVVVTDLITRAKIKDTWLNDERIYYTYLYQDHDRPEHIAQKYYGDEDLHWIILFTNTVFDSNFDFPLSSWNFSKYVNDKYAEEGKIFSRSGMEYAQMTPDPVYRYQKTVKIAGSEGYSERSYVIDRKAYDELAASEIYSTGDIYTSTTSTLAYSNLVTVENNMNMQVGDILYNNPSIPPFTIITEISNDDPTLIKISQEAKTTLIGYKTYFASVYGDATVTQIIRKYPQVTIYNREFEVNESKRKIKLLKKEFVDQAKTELYKLLK